MTKSLLIKYLCFSFFISLFLVPVVKGAGFGEHKLIGDSAFKKYCATHPEFAALLKQLLGSEPLDINSPLIPLKNTDPMLFYRRDRYAGQYPVVIAGGRAVTYGDLTALSGDHSPDYFEAYQRFFNDGTFRPSGLFSHLFDDVLSQYDKELRNLDKGGTGYNPVFIEFIRLAAQDRSHFHIPAMPLRQEIDIVGQRIYDYATDLIYSGLTGNDLAALNRQKMLAYFETNSVAKYSILHTIAKTYYIHVFESLRDAQFNQLRADKARIAGRSAAAHTFQQAADSAGNNAKKYLLLTLFTNAFSEHYLQDMFAGGHFFVDRNAGDFLGLEAKGIHDFFGRYGLHTFVEKKPVTLYGDGRYTEEQLNLAVAANLASLQDVFNLDTATMPALNPRKPEQDYLQMLRTPTEEPGELFPALKKIPDVPLGQNFSSQRKSIGRSLSGSNYGLYGLGSSRSYGAGVTTGFNYLVATPDSSKNPLEAYFGFGFNAFFEATSDTRNSKDRKWQGRLGLGLNFLFFDWIYTNASLTSSYPVAMRAKFEQGIQIKPLPWKYGIHIGVAEYTGNISPSPAFTISIIHY